jgi:hypothetical protein
MYAYEKESRACHALTCCLAATAAAASQCLWQRGLAPVEGALGPLLDAIRDRCPPGNYLRSQGEEMQRVIELFEGMESAE